MVTEQADQPGNPAPRVAPCLSCGRPVLGGARGPIAQLCVACRAKENRELKWRIVTARKLASRTAGAESIAQLLGRAERSAGRLARRHGPYGE